MANFKLTQTGEQIQADLNLLDKNSATSGQVLTANGSGGSSWQNVSSGSGGLYFHQITLSFTPNDSSENPENQSIMAIFGLYLNKSEAFTLDTFCSYLSQLSNYGEMIAGYGLTTSGIYMDMVHNSPAFAHIWSVSVQNNTDIYVYYTYVSNSNMAMTSGVFSSGSTFSDTVAPV